jgi:hypothetical protein
MRRRLLLLLAAAFVVWVVFATFWILQLARDLKEGRDAASRARNELGPEQIADQEPLGDLRIAESRFRAAHGRAGGVILTPLRFAPVIGRQLRSVEALAGAAELVAKAGVDAVEQAGVLFDDPAGEGQARVDQVRALSELVDDVANQLESIDDLGPIKGLVAPLADARNELAADLADARRGLADARTGARAALSLIEGPRRYLVLAANNSEMRAGSGMWLQGGVLTTGAGKLDLEQMVSLHLDADPPDGAVRPSGDLASRWGYLRPGDEWRNLMASPRFPQSAELAVQMWKAATGEDVDGVLAVDAIGLQAIVEATGPVTVGDQTVGAEDVPQQVLHDQYLQYGDIRDQAGQNQAERREALAALASSAVAAIDRGDYPASTLIRTLGDAIEGRHLLAWTPDEVEQAGWDAAGMNGELDADSLLVSVLNQGGTKLDWFLDVEGELAVERVAGEWEVTVSVQLRNDTPAQGEPTYVQGPYPGLDLDPGEYRGLLAVNIPGAATEPRFDDVETLTVRGPDGPTQVIGFRFDLPRGETRGVVLRFRLPSGADHLVVEPSARVPGITWRYGTEEWEDSSSFVTNWEIR